MPRKPSTFIPRPEKELDAYPVDDRGYTDTRGAADYWKISVSKLNKDRHFGVGADYVVFGRAVRYSYAALDAEAAKNRRSSTRQLRGRLHDVGKHPRGPEVSGLLQQAGRDAGEHVPAARRAPRGPPRCMKTLHS